MSQCTAISKQSGQRCQRQASRGRTVCAIHGGKSLIGMAQPQFKHGRHSAYLPIDLNRRYRAGMRDPDLLSLKAEVVLVDTRLDALLTTLAEGSGAERWEALTDAWGDFMGAYRGQDPAAMATCLSRLDGLIKGQPSDRETWRDIISLTEQRRKLVESEQKHLIAMQQTLTTEEAMGLLATVVDTVRRHVTDRAALSAISADIGRLVAPALRPGTPTGGPA